MRRSVCISARQPCNGFGQLAVVLLAGFGSFVGGCGSAEYSSFGSMHVSDAFVEEEVATTTPVGDEARQIANTNSPLASTAVSVTTPANRHIIYTTSIELVVEDYGNFETRLPQLVKEFGGFVASSETDRKYKDRQSGSWVVRVPAGSYNRFLAGVDSLGFCEMRRENAQDVTEEYIDVETRIANKQKLESRIVAMLEERSGKLSEVLDIERELARVREEIERMQGRLRFLKDRTTLATVTIQCREESEYIPPKAPTFLARLSSSWTKSLRFMRMLSENCVVALTACIPWIVIGGLPAWFTLRWFKKRRRPVNSRAK